MAKSDVKLQIKSWKECPIDTYYEIVDVLNEESISQGEKEIKILAILCNVDEDVIWDLDITKAKELMSQTAWVNEFKIDQKAKYKNIIMNGQKYTIADNLDNFTTAQYIDFQTFWAKKDNKQYLGNILACFIIPKGKKYGNDYDVSEVAQTIRKEIDIVTAQEILFFSHRKLLDSMKALRTYLKLQMIRMKKKLSQENYLKMLAATEMRWNDIIDGLLV